MCIRDRAVLDREVPLCIDADGITLLAQHADLRERIHGMPVVLTPHAGEFARIAGDVGTDRVAATRRAAADLGVTVLLKGNATVVAAHDVVDGCTSARRGRATC